MQKAKSLEEESDSLVDFNGSEVFCFTKEGINLTINFTYFYKLVPEKLEDFYFEYGNGWKQGIARISMESIKESTVTFRAKDYFTQRNTINAKFEKNLQKSFDEKAIGAVIMGILN